MSGELSAELVRVRRRAIHALLDASMLIFSMVMALIWDLHGAHRDAFLLLVVSYWGSPWRDRTDG